MALTRFALNIEMSNIAAAQSTIMNFNSFCEIGGEYLAANEDGVYTIGECGDDNLIDSYFALIKSDFGIKNKKRLVSAYVNYWSTGSIYFKITVDDDMSRIFVLPHVRSSKYHGNRLPLTMDMEGYYFLLEIGNINGCDFSIDSVYLNMQRLGLKQMGSSL